MFDKKVTNNITKEVRNLTLGKESIVVLRTDDNISDEQYRLIRENFEKYNKVEGVSFIILEGGVKLDCVLSRA
jgi:hypothetical protein